MNGILMLPYIFETEQLSLSLRISERGDLCLNKQVAGSGWQNDELLIKDCRRFTAAPAPDETLYVIAADGKSNLRLFKITETGASESPFAVKTAAGSFVLSFSPEGSGYFFCADGSEPGGFITAEYKPAKGWSAGEVSLGRKKSLPAGLLVDTTGSLHLLAYESSEGVLSYHCYSKALGRWTEAAALDTSLQLSSAPAIWQDANENIHICWYVNRSQTICHRTKIAGGWPRGGWQPEQFIPVDTRLQILSILEEEGRVKIWSIGTGTGVQVYHYTDGTWQQREVDTDCRIPLRQGFLGSSYLNLAAEVPPETLFFASKPFPVRAQIQEEPVTKQKDDQDELLILQIKQLMDEKRNLKITLSKKEESISLLQQMLERAQESFKNQRTEWISIQKSLDAKVRIADDELRQRELESKNLREQFDRLQKQLVDSKADRAEILTLRERLALSQQQEAKLSAAVKRLESELSAKKGVWGAISSVFQKKP